MILFYNITREYLKRVKLLWSNFWRTFSDATREYVQKLQDEE